MTKNIRITPYGGLGNRMFQYMFALALKARVPEAIVSGAQLPEWGISLPGVPQQVGSHIVVRRSDVPFEKLVRTMRRSENIDVELLGLSLRIEYYERMLGEFRRAFPPKPTVGAGPDEIAINVRGAEILSGGHENFIPVPISFYARIIVSTGLAPVFVGQIGDDAYSAALRARFPEARFLTHGSGLGDFHFLRGSHHIVLAVSSYSWLAGWLSETAEKIYMPVIGLYHPGARPDCDLLPLRDARYEFFQSNLRSWSGAPHELSRVIDAPMEAFGFRRGAPSALRLGLGSTPRLLAQSWLRRHLLMLHTASAKDARDLVRRAEERRAQVAARGAR